MAWLPSRRFSADEYLARYKLRAFLVDLVTELLESRPAAPVDFVCNYLVTHQRTVSPLADAYRAVRLAAASTFPSYLFAAFNFAVARPRSQTAYARAIPLVERVGDGDFHGGLANNAYFKLVRLLCADLPEAAAVRLLALLCRPGGGAVAMRAGLDKWDVVNFGHFSSGIMALRACESFVRESSDLFRHALAHSSSSVEFAPKQVDVLTHLIALRGQPCTGEQCGEFACATVDRSSARCSEHDIILASKVSLSLFRGQPNNLVYLSFQDKAIQILFALLPTG